MGWHAEVWNLPDSSPHEVIIKSLPVQSVTWADGIDDVGTATITLPASYDRLDEIVKGTDNVQSLVRLFWDDDLAFAFFPEFTSKPYTDDAGTVIDISGDGIKSAMRWAIAYPYDYSAAPSVTQDHIYGNIRNEASFWNGDLEALTLNGGAESGEIDPWSDTSGSGFFGPPGVTLSVQTTTVHTGTYAYEFTGTADRSGMQLSVPVIGGEQYAFSALLQDTGGNTGDRYVMMVRLGSDDSTMDTGAGIVNGYAVFELDGAAFEAGAADGTWQSLYGQITFAADIEQTTIYIVYDDAGLPTGSAAVDQIAQVGPGVGLFPWEALDDPLTFVLDGSVYRSGQGSLKWKTRTGSALGGSSVRQKVLDTVPGRTYTFGGYFRHGGVGSEPIRLVAYRNGSANVNQVGSTLHQIPTGTGWTYAWVTFEADTESLYVDWRYDDTGGSPDIWVDDLHFSEGLPATTIGAIWQDLMDDIQVDHIAESSPGSPRSVLDWIDYSGFSDDQDNNTDTWDSVLAMTVVMGTNYHQALNQARGLFYEANLVWNGTDWELELYNPDGMGTDYSTASFPFITQGTAIVSGELQESIAPATHALAVGADGVWNESSKLSASSLGRREFYIQDKEALDETTVTRRAQAALTSFEETSTGIKLTFSEAANALPVRDYTYGDIVKVVLPKYDIDKAYRVYNISGSWGKTGKSTFTVDFASEVIPPGASTATAVSKILDRFEGAPADPGPQTFYGLGLGDDSGGPIETSVLVASADASLPMKQVADFVCDGTADQVEINAAFDAIGDVGVVQLSKGDFYVTDEIIVPSYCSLVGAGMFGTTIYAVAGGGTGYSVVKGQSSFGRISDMWVQTGTNNYEFAVATTSSLLHSTVERVAGYMQSTTSPANGAFGFTDGTTGRELYVPPGNKGYGVYIYGGPEATKLIGCTIEGATNDGDATDGYGIHATGLSGNGTIILGNHVTGTVTGIYITEDKCVVVSNWTDDGITIDAAADSTVLGLNYGTVTDNGTNTQDITSESSVLTTKGDLWGFDTADNRFPVGANGTLIVADSTQALGVKYDTQAGYETEAWGIDGTVTTGTGTSRLYAPVGMTIVDFRISLSAGTATVDVHKDGTTVFTTQANRPAISSGNVSSLAVPDVTSVAADSYLTVDVDAASSAEDLVVTMRWRKT